ncbi:hypothetical protein H6F61_23805 [Cyanobacteria bacterium FACHB-472]|nr:hypothetical protein [Cyanobacteria bacterium FACHB-472]
MLNRFKPVLLTALLVAIASPTIIPQQVQAQSLDRRYYGQIEQLLERIETRTDSFRRIVDGALDRSRMDGSSREDNINEYIRNFEQATNRLRDRYNRRQVASNDVREVLNRAARIDEFMQRRRLGGEAEREWASLRRDLAQLDRIAPGTTTPGGDRRSYNGQVQQLVNNIERNANRFRNSLDQALDSTRLDGSNREDQINQYAKNFESATNRLRDRYNDRQAATSDVQQVLTSAYQINTFMQRRRLGGQVESDWAMLRRDLNELERVYFNRSGRF